MDMFKENTWNYCLHRLSKYKLAEGRSMFGVPLVDLDKEQLLQVIAYLEVEGVHTSHLQTQSIKLND